MIYGDAPKHTIYNDMRLRYSQSEASCQSLRNDNRYFDQSQTSKCFTVQIPNLSTDKTT